MCLKLHNHRLICLLQVFLAHVYTRILDFLLAPFYNWMVVASCLEQSVLKSIHDLHSHATPSIGFQPPSTL
ncbi:uncharacterized protein K444DRAFT_257193 [Hyaloscypha bicolor E]|uniref:Uncharacterized protein n=1 Tax=Hyaloscypha bicolor E TaxID=1095630 RepID=A0A2J6SNA3_9HELO|nr:uncharacterized protein K444DRAFT_257193 [Hyaloscypha bicolor E]PMD52245.1 hypothetical protein K444DRAFT_257193 [Hyaloscypha bicolor E]